jgi:hypothetical protein
MTSRAGSTPTEAATATDAVTPERFRGVRAASRALAAPLSAEDACVQSMPDASPTKWHLGHTTWFFETFVVAREMPERAPFDDSFAVLFNSYYNAVGDQFPRPRRGLLTRPSLDRVLAYREDVDAAVERCLERGVDEDGLRLIEIGLHHEQQHQELTLMDVRHLLSCNPTDPAYAPDPGPGESVPVPPTPVAGPDSRVGCTRSATTGPGSRSTTRARDTRSCSVRSNWRRVR